MSERSLGAALAHALKARGVDVIFGIPGVHNVELYRGIEQAGITHILTRHEQGAGFMADGYARATGKPGVAFIISGPGLTNIMTPMGQAYSDSVPMLVISSCLPDAPEIAGRLHQMRDQQGAAATVCDWSETAYTAEQAFAFIDRAFNEFATKRPRPKHLTIPIDVLEAPCDITPTPPEITRYLTVPPQDTKTLATLLNAAHKPLFIFGGGAARASQAALDLLNRAGAAAMTTYAGRGIIPANHPLNFSACLAQPSSAQILAKADLLIAIGTELADVDIWRKDLGYRCKMVRVDIDDTVLNDAHDAHLKIKADAAALMPATLPQINQSPPKWDATKITAAKATFRAECDANRPGIARLCDAMQDVLPDETMFYSDMTQFAYVAKELYQMPRPGHWHHPFGFGTLGYALPAAIGGKLARPNHPTIAIAGDYGFQYTLQELGTLAELNLCLPIILWDNEKLKEIEDSMIRSQIAPNAVIAQNPDFALLSAAYGIAYTKPTSIEDFKSALQAALKTDGPTIIHTTPVTNSSS
ncbi:MAG: 5-guanidino-2-oxopentanoate decarboxylase [Paracoccaceae bacterium]